jgi:hypothetical protein
VLLPVVATDPNPPLSGKMSSQDDEELAVFAEDQVPEELLDFEEDEEEEGAVD